MDVDDVYFQQGGATCHTSGETIGLLREKFPDRVISQNGDYNQPPRLCDLRGYSTRDGPKNRIFKKNIYDVDNEFNKKEEAAMYCPGIAD